MGVVVKVRLDILEIAHHVLVAIGVVAQLFAARRAVQ